MPGMVRPSDLMGIEDYKDLRLNTTVKGGVAGIFSGVGTSESGQCSLRRHGSDALIYSSTRKAVLAKETDSQCASPCLLR